MLNYHFIEQLKSLPFIDSIYLYGSRARGDCAPRSDIDLAIACPKATKKDWQTILAIIEEADTLLKIDCVRLDTLSNEDLLKNIKRDQKIIYQKSAL